MKIPLFILVVTAEIAFSELGHALPSCFKRFTSTGKVPAADQKQYATVHGVPEVACLTRCLYKNNSTQPTVLNTVCNSIIFVDETQECRLYSTTLDLETSNTSSLKTSYYEKVPNCTDVSAAVEIRKSDSPSTSLKHLQKITVVDSDDQTSAGNKKADTAAVQAQPQSGCYSAYCRTPTTTTQPPTYGTPPTTQPPTYAVQAAWSPWGTWSPCTATCGVGASYTRTRQCQGGTSCAGDPSQTQTCTSLPACPPQCSGWTPWGQCSVTCGQGTQTRTQTCTTGQSYGAGGAVQQGASTPQTDTQPCTATAPSTWSDWGQWAACSVTCGQGQATRTRVCSGGCGTPSYIGLKRSRAAAQNRERRGAIFLQQPSYSSTAPPATSSGQCSGSAQDTQQCSPGPCPSYSAWGPWTSCSSSCGAGTQTRSRYCSHGNLCAGLAADSSACNAGQCPTWGDWTSWLPCPITCGIASPLQYVAPPTPGCANCPVTYATIPPVGAVSAPGGVQTRSRLCSVPGQCQGLSTDTQACTQPLPPCSTWIEWGPWSPCSITCTSGYSSQGSSCATCPNTGAAPSSGTQSRSRTCTVPGQCTGQSSDTQPCQQAPPPCATWSDWTPWTSCPVQSCQPTGYQSNQGGSSGGAIGPPSQGAQAQQAQQSTRSRQCQPAGAQCVGNAQDAQQCPAQLACPVAAVWADWSPWSACSTSCGPGQLTRSRQCQTGSCSGPASDSQACQNVACAGGYYKPQYQGFFENRKKSPGT